MTESFPVGQIAPPTGPAEHSPAVVLPSGLKAGRSLLSPASVVAALMPSSSVTVTVRSSPPSSTILVVTGTISCRNRPERCARAALQGQKSRDKCVTSPRLW